MTQTIYLLHPPFKKPFLNKVKPKKINMAKDCSEGPSDWSLAGHLTLHQGKRGPSRAPTGAAQVTQQLNEGARCSSGGLSVVRKNEAIFGANEGNHSNRPGRNPGPLQSPAISVSLQPILSLTSHHLSGSSQDRVRLPGSKQGPFGH